MVKMINEFNKFYTIDEIMAFSKSIQKKVISSLSSDNLHALIVDCQNRYYAALNNSDNFNFAIVNKYANLYTMLIEYNDAA